MVYILAFLVMALIMAGMAIGAIAGRGPLKGSCGGLSAVGIEGRCDICGDDPSLCKKTSDSDAQQTSDNSPGFYDATK